MTMTTELPPPPGALAELFQTYARVSGALAPPERAGPARRYALTLWLAGRIAAPEYATGEIERSHQDPAEQMRILWVAATRELQAARRAKRPDEARLAGSGAAAAADDDDVVDFSLEEREATVIAWPLTDRARDFCLESPDPVGDRLVAGGPASAMQASLERLGWKTRRVAATPYLAYATEPNGKMYRAEATPYRPLYDLSGPVGKLSAGSHILWQEGRALFFPRRLATRTDILDRLSGLASFPGGPYERYRLLVDNRELSDDATVDLDRPGLIVNVSHRGEG